MPRLVLLVALLAVACGNGTNSAADASSAPGPDAAPAGPDASALDAGSQDASAMPADAAMPPDAELAYDAGPKCASQSECGDPVADQIAYVCTGSHCHPPGPLAPDGGVDLVTIDFECVYDAVLTQPGARPQVQLTRLILNRKVDGSALTCAEVLSRAGKTQATRSQLDADPQINQVFRNLTALTWSGSTQGQTLFKLFYDAPKASGLLLYGEAWYGLRDGNDPTGDRASAACTEDVDLSSAVPNQKLAIQFKP